MFRGHAPGCGVFTPAESHISRAIKLLLNLEIIDLSALSLGSARGIGLYGSWARGTNDQESDLDVWIKADSLLEQSMLARLQRDLSLQTGSEVNLLILTPERLESLKTEDPPFYNSLVKDFLARHMVHTKHALCRPESQSLQLPCRSYHIG